MERLPDLWNDLLAGAENVQDQAAFNTPGEFPLLDRDAGDCAVRPSDVRLRVYPGPDVEGIQPGRHAGVWKLPGNRQ